MLTYRTLSQAATELVWFDREGRRLGRIGEPANYSNPVLSPDEKTIAEAAKMAGAKSSPSADRRGSVEYKKEMARVLTARALRKAVQRAGGK